MKDNKKERKENIEKCKEDGLKDIAKAQNIINKYIQLYYFTAREEQEAAGETETVRKLRTVREALERASSSLTCALLELTK